MENVGWIHIEGSVYMSSEPLSATGVAYVIDGLKLEYPYLTKCIRSMHQADIANIHSLNHLFEYDGTPGKFTPNETSHENVDEKVFQIYEQ